MERCLLFALVVVPLGLHFGVLLVQGLQDIQNKRTHTRPTAALNPVNYSGVELSSRPMMSFISSPSCLAISVFIVNLTNRQPKGPCNRYRPMHLFRALAERKCRNRE